MRLCLGALSFAPCAGLAIAGLPLLLQQLLVAFAGRDPMLQPKMLLLTGLSFAIGVCAAFFRRGKLSIRVIILCSVLAATVILVTPWLLPLALEWVEPWGRRNALLVLSLVFLGVPGGLLGVIFFDRFITCFATAKSAVMRSTFSLGLGVLSLGGAVFVAPYLASTTMNHCDPSNIYLFVSALLIIHAALTLHLLRKERLLLGCLLPVMWITSALLPRNSHDPNGLLAISHQSEAEYRFIDRQGVRHVLRDGIIVQGVDPGIWVPQLTSSGTFLLSTEMLAQKGRALIAGIPGTLFIQELQEMKWDVEWLGLTRDTAALFQKHLNYNISDAKRFPGSFIEKILEPGELYDMVLIDVFTRTQLELFEFETLSDWAPRVRDTGVVFVRLRVSNWEDIVLGHLTHTLRRIFSEVWCIPVDVNPRLPDTVMLLASNRIFDHMPLGVADHPGFMNDQQLALVALWERRSWENRFVPKVPAESPSPKRLESLLNSALQLHRQSAETNFSDWHLNH